MKTQAGGCSPPGDGAGGAAQEWAEGGGEDAPCATRAVFACFLSWVPDLISFLEEEEWGVGSILKEPGFLPPPLGNEYLPDLGQLSSFCEMQKRSQLQGYREG